MGLQQFEGERWARRDWPRLMGRQPVDAGLRTFMVADKRVADGVRLLEGCGIDLNALAGRR